MSAFTVTLAPAPLVLGANKISRAFAAVLEADGVLVGADAAGDVVIDVPESQAAALKASRELLSVETRVTDDAVIPVERVVIGYQQGAPLNPSDVEALGVEVEEDYKPGSFLIVKLKPGVQLNKAFVEKLNGLAGLDYASPSFIAPALPGAVRSHTVSSSTLLSGMPNDPLCATQWGLTAVGAQVAWSTGQGSSEIIVAVVDTGIDYSHPDITNNIWHSSTGTHGFNFHQSNGDPMDLNGHGTHVAGIIGAVGNNGEGVAGVNWRVRLMALRWLGITGNGEITNAIKCIDFAIQNGARIINASWWWPYEEPLLDAAIRRANDAGVLFVAAAGNFATSPHNNQGDNDKLDTRGRYPSCVPAPNVIAVGSIREDLDRAETSHWGRNTVHLFAPGDSIHSTYTNPRYYVDSGTSMAAPYVSGAIALAMAHASHSQKSHLAIRDLIFANVRQISGLTDRCRTGGLLSIGFLGT